MIFSNKHSFSHEMESLNQMDKTLRREIYLARNIQTQLLNGPKPHLTGGEVTGSSLPARLIGGDYYDFYPLRNGKLRFIIGDVMGKGIPAAMLMILTRGAFRSAAESTEGPGDTLTSMNNAIHQDLRVLRSFVTLFCADWDPKTGILTYANAGHIPPFQIGEQGVIELPRTKGVMLGGLPNQIYKECQLHLKKNEILFLYTDGIIEAQNPNGEQFKSARLIEILKKYKGEKVEQIEESVANGILAFTEGAPQKDDITMVILKVMEHTTDIKSFNSPALQT